MSLRLGLELRVCLDGQPEKLRDRVHPVCTMFWYIKSVDFGVKGRLIRFKRGEGLFGRTVLGK